MWETRRLTNLWVFTACYRDSFTFFFYPPPTLIHWSHRFTRASKTASWKSSDCRRLNRTTCSGIICDFRTSLREFLNTILNRFKPQTLPKIDRKQFFAYIESFCPQKRRKAQQNAALRYYTPQTRSLFWLLKPASERAHVRLLSILSWSCTVLLLSDTRRKPITFITSVLLPFVTYLLTLPCRYFKYVLPDSACSNGLYV
jgi:hypothetical protein